MTRDTRTNGGEGQNPTASTQSDSTISSPDADTRPELSTYEFHGLAIFTTHGLADGASTIYATSVLSTSVEANPLIAQLDVISSWFGPTLTTIGLLIAITNVLVGVAA